MSLLCYGTNLAWCAGSTALKCLGINRVFKSSIATRIAYAGLLLCTSVTSWIMLTPMVYKKLKFINGNGSIFNKDCEDGYCYGLLAVYRVCFASSLLHIILALTMIGVTSSKEIRGKIQNGFWGPKMLLWFVTTILMFFIDNKFFEFWSKYIAIVGAILFMLIQLIILIDFSYSWVETFIENYENTDDKRYMYLLIISTVVMFIGAIALTIIMYVIFGKSGCTMNQVFISINLFLCILITILSILPEVQYANPQSGIAQASMIVIYATYIVCSAISNEPEDSEHCNPFNKKTQVTTTILGVLFTFISVAYSTTRAAANGLFLGDSSDEFKSPLLPEEEKVRLTSNDDEDEDDDDDNKNFLDDETKGTSYSYSFFHLIFAFAGMYIAMLLTNWNTVKSGDDFNIVVGKSWASVWVKIITGWIVILLYLWSVVAPVFMPDNDW